MVGRPNLAAIYSVEDSGVTHARVMELVDRTPASGEIQEFPERTADLVAESLW